MRTSVELETMISVNSRMWLLLKAGRKVAKSEREEEVCYEEGDRL